MDMAIPMGDITVGSMTVGSITVRPEGEASVVTLVGEIDGSLRDAAGASMGAVALHTGSVVVDASALTFIDSTGLAFILQLYRLCQESGRTCMLRRPDTFLLQMLRIIGMGDHIPVEPAPVAC